MIGTGELLVILCVVLILFGGKKLPELARSIGIGLREFKRACQGIDEEESGNKKTESITIEVENDSKSQ